MSISSVGTVTVGEATKASELNAVANLVNQIIPNVSTKTANYTITDTDDITFFIGKAASTGAVVFTLPTATDNTNRVITFINGASSGGTVTIDGEGSETINGIVSIYLDEQYQQNTIICDGTEWFVAGSIMQATSDQSYMGGFHLIDEEDRNTNWDVNDTSVGDSAGSAETANFSASVATGTTMIWAYVRVETNDTGEDVRLFLRDSASTETDAERTQTMRLRAGRNTDDTQILLGVPMMIHARNGQFDYWSAAGAHVDTLIVSLKGYWNI
jgi:hypothetical protein